MDPEVHWDPAPTAPILGHPHRPRLRPTWATGTPLDILLTCVSHLSLMGLRTSWSLCPESPFFTGTSPGASGSLQRRPLPRRPSLSSTPPALLACLHATDPSEWNSPIVLPHLPPLSDWEHPKGRGTSHSPLQPQHLALGLAHPGLQCTLTEEQTRQAGRPHRCHVSWWLDCVSSPIHHPPIPSSAQAVAGIPCYQRGRSQVTSEE